ncbi:uncharacterized protein Dwil_GK23322 [Drosophila willistoni]|uniref:Uncharacterized protein n=1 Tax=Drosophila willistoni TaxID=7260 RepID=B4NNI7_DROWI|nr:cell wall protein TIR4 [Drosophila willistoni]EDW85926.1 uncharacterized protein Dwil_GK23322 [Drosophila willistoni]
MLIKPLCLVICLVASVRGQTSFSIPIPNFLAGFFGGGTAATSSANAAAGSGTGSGTGTGSSSSNNNNLDDYIAQSLYYSSGLQYIDALRQQREQNYLNYLLALTLANGQFTTPAPTSSTTSTAVTPTTSTAIPTTTGPSTTSTAVAPTASDTTSTAVAPTASDTTSTAVAPTASDNTSTAVAPAGGDTTSTAVAPAGGDTTSTAVAPAGGDTTSTAVAPSDSDGTSTAVAPARFGSYASDFTTSKPLHYDQNQFYYWNGQNLMKQGIPPAGSYIYIPYDPLGQFQAQLRANYRNIPRK